MIDEYLNILSNSDVFSGIKHSDIETLLSCLNVGLNRCCRNESLVKKGEVRGSFFIVLDGQMKTVHCGNSNLKNFDEIVGPSQSFGLAFCLTKVPTHVSFRAARDSVVAEIDCARLISPCGKNCELHYEVIRNLLKVLSGKVMHLSEKINYIHTGSLRAKLASYILNCFYKSGQKIFYVNMNITELAEYLGSSRSSLSRELSAMQSDGLVDHHLKCFKILDLEGLKNLSADD